MDRTDAVQSAIVPTLQNLAFGFGLTFLLGGLAYIVHNRHAIIAFHRAGMRRLADAAAREQAAAKTRHPAGKARAASRSRTAHDAA